MSTNQAAPYRRLPGLSRGYGAYLQLWEGEDHLLVVETTGYTEDYKRFYYRDIQALILQRNRFRAFGNLLLGLACALASVPVIVFQPGLWALAIPGFLLVSLLINTLLGPTCTVRLITSVNDQRLSSIGRDRTFRKLLLRLGPRIEQAQGTLAREELVARADAVPLREAAPALRVRPSAAAAAADRRPAGLVFHGAAALGLGLFGLLAAVKIVAGTWLIFVLACAVFALVFPCVVLAIARQSSGLVDPAVRRWTWFALLFQVGGAFMSWIILIVVSGATGEVNAPSEQMLEYVVTGLPTGNAATLVAHLFLALGGLVLALIGGFLVRRAAMPARPAPPPLPRAPPPLPHAGAAP